jgi:hypothetical protein
VINLNPYQNTIRNSIGFLKNIKKFRRIENKKSDFRLKGLKYIPDIKNPILKT